LVLNLFGVKVYNIDHNFVSRFLIMLNLNNWTGDTSKIMVRPP
jgi:hypothetical protein